MRRKAGTLALIGLLASCGGGGSPADVRVNSPPDPDPASIVGPKNFLIFPNPQVQADGSLQTVTAAYAERNVMYRKTFNRLRPGSACSL